jgi:tRNA nucleotidyltransferase/poly(A) polymerase
MSDYMFMLESHLTPDQRRAADEVQAAAAEVNLSLYLTGGAMRDMLGGFPIRDLDFTVEGNALKLARALSHRPGVELVSSDESRKVAELRLPGPVTVSISMARQEKYAKPAVKPSVHPATIHEDLRGRDFTINAIALSLNRASRGLLVDPTNGLADIEHRELRTTSNYTLYDDPSRMLRLIRFKVRLGYDIAERTRMQYENVRMAELENKITPQALCRELHHIAEEPNAGDVVKALDDEKLLKLFSPALTGPNLNLAGLAKLQKARLTVPFGVDLHLEPIGLFLCVLTERLSAKEKSGLIASSGLGKAEVDAWQKLDTKAKKLEKDLKSAKLNRPSLLYAVLSKAPGDQVLYLLMKSGERLVQDRIKNYLQKYLPLAQEITDRDVTAETGLEPGTPKFQKAKDAMIAARLEARPKKVIEPEAEEQQAPVHAHARSRSSSSA